MNTTITYPIIEMSDWFSVSKIKKMTSNRKNGLISVKSYISKLKSVHKKTKPMYLFDITVLNNKEVHLIYNIEEHRRSYLEKKSIQKTRAKRGMMSSLDSDIIPFKFDGFIIKESYDKYCHISPQKNPGKIFKVYYDEILIKKESVSK